MKDNVILLLKNFAQETGRLAWYVSDMLVANDFSKNVKLEQDNSHTKCITWHLLTEMKINCKNSYTFLFYALLLDPVRLKSFYKAIFYSKYQTLSFKNTFLWQPFYSQCRHTQSYVPVELSYGHLIRREQRMTASEAALLRPLNSTWH